MPERPHLACIVADLRLARIALREAAAAGATLELWSPPDGARSLGVGYWAALDRAIAKAAEPGRAATVLDCGAAPGFALSAFREGLCTVHVAVRADVREKLASIAEQCGGALHPGPPPELDLRDRLDPAASCRFALQDRGGRTEAGDADNRG
ncbi:MAG: hypothetical protein OXF89_14110 [Rhodospirillaceae bacterium]|nr:hypothetical protein [Rhodospirillaceae bacterium]MCY4064938.1 hypothetical protein [Rhodospirillaceae bacterium]